jgi:UDP-N-acetylmuramate dehydrogenase
MSEFFENYPLKSRNTFGLEVQCRYFFETSSLNELITFIKEGLEPQFPFTILGEGSNILFRGDYPGTIIHPALMGIEILSEDENSVHVKAMAGENWDSFVNYCVEKNWSGLENLSLIPGSVGSSPVQNIGAYGVEAKDRILEVEGFFIETGKIESFTVPECYFSYRNSIFKQEFKNSFVITSVIFNLSKKHNFELRYGPVEKEFLKKQVQDLSSLRQTIIEIRESKLPDPSKLGNAGSFFKNPVISNLEFRNLQSRYPEIPSYPSGSEHTKIPAAWLIENAGWKRVREGNVGTYPSQPLVIVNYGGASGAEILQFAEKITASIRDKFGITIVMEVNLV